MLSLPQSIRFHPPTPQPIKCFYIPQSIKPQSPVFHPIRLCPLPPPSTKRCSPTPQPIRVCLSQLNYSLNSHLIRLPYLTFQPIRLCLSAHPTNYFYFSVPRPIRFFPPLLPPPHPRRPLAPAAYQKQPCPSINKNSLSGEAGRYLGLALTFTNSVALGTRLSVLASLCFIFLNCKMGVVLLLPS